ncbi:MAG: carboxylating nicotinate-nucleotide diphosphorylase, partial [Phycisphaerales bacterium JB037]
MPIRDDLNALALPKLFDRLCVTGGAGDRLDRLLDLAFEEDVDGGDVTSLACFAEPDRARASVVLREPGVVAGLAAAGRVLERFAPDSTLELHAADGDRARPGTTLATLEGPAIEVLGAERTLLNLLGRLTGIATRTAAFVDAVGESGRRPRLLDTRKMTPGWRGLEKYAVRCGGGHCHRLGLHDAMLIKDNHLAAMARRDPGRPLAELVRSAIEQAPERVSFVEVEVDTLDQFTALLPIEAIDIVLLDNMSTDQLAEAVRQRDRTRPG